MDKRANLNRALISAGFATVAGIVVAYAVGLSWSLPVVVVVLAYHLVYDIVYGVLTSSNNQEPEKPKQINSKQYCAGQWMESEWDSWGTVEQMRQYGMRGR